MADTMISNFDLLALKVETYYSQKVIPTGKTVANYGDLVTAIQTQKTAVQTALSKVRAEEVSFTCESQNPGQYLRDYNTFMKSVTQSLKQYREI